MSWIFSAKQFRAIFSSTSLPIKGKKGAETRNPLSPEILKKMHAYWHAANYLSVGQIYLRDRLLDYKRYIVKYGEDLPEIRNWKWMPAK